MATRQQKDCAMPIIQVLLLKGHPSGVKTRLANALTDAYRMVIPAPSAAITVTMHDVAPGNYMRGGAVRRPVEALPEPTAHLRAYITALRDGDFDTAQTFLTDDCTFRLPGGKVVDTPAAVMEWSVARTEIDGFRITSMDAMAAERGAVVYLHGMLSGTRQDGTRYDDKRWVGRYAFDGDKIFRADIWDDVAEELLWSDAGDAAR
jgi:phenylpyruvate tautomerase PptA (4-oxalocrotonate tautomerase family)